MRNKKTYLVLLVVAIVAVMIWNVANEPGIKDLEGNFSEVAYIRNEQNSGPVVRIYAVTVQGQPWKEMEQYGNYMPHTKYGTTRVYFFQAGKTFPSQLTLGDENIPDEVKKHCIAVYEKDGMSQVNLQKYPYSSPN